MEPMHKCDDCGGWVKSYSASTCTCTPRKEYCTTGTTEFLNDEDRRYLIPAPGGNRKARRAATANHRKNNRSKK